jgi:hypothetical protein
MNMRYLTYILLLITAFTSCEILEVDPKSQLEAEDAINDKRGLQSAMSGAYDVLQSAAIAQDVLVFGDMLADNLIHIGTKKEYRQISDNRIVAENVYVEGLWNRSYDGINRVNNILVQIPNVGDISDQDRDRYTGECYFLRAYHYFNLVKFFGGVPLKTEPTTSIAPSELYRERASVDSTYAQIVSDLEKAMNNLEGISVENVYGNYYAAKALMARVKLYMGEYEDAAAMAIDVIDNGGYTLEQDSAGFANIFDEGSSSNEVIWQIDFVKDDDNNALADWFLPAGRFEVAAWETYDRESSIADEFEDDDIRKFTTVRSQSYEGREEYYCAKYLNTNTGNDNVIVLRLGEMYLIAAEALNAQGFDPSGDAFDYLNDIRTRANQNTYTSGELSSQDKFATAIEEERRLELAFEGHRFFDLRRTGRIDDVIPDIGTLKENNWLLPIPQSEMDTNELMEQNGTY